MPITSNVNGIKKILSTVTTNIVTTNTSVKKVLNTITANDNGVKRIIHSSNFVTFEEFNKSSLASGELTNAQYIRGEKVTVSFTATSKELSVDNCYRVRIWFNNIKVGDKVEMNCSFTRSSSGYYINSIHCNADGTIAAHNGFTDDGLYGSNGNYIVSYTSTTNKNYIDINMGYNQETTLVFNVLALKINGKNIFGNIPTITFSSVDTDSSDGVSQQNTSGSLGVYCSCSSKVTSAHAISDPFEWVSDSHRFHADISVCCGKYTFSSENAPSGTQATAPTGSAYVSLIDNTTGTTKTIISATNYTGSELNGDLDSSLFIVGHSYSLGIYADQSNTSADSYAYAQAIYIYVY